LRCGVPHEFESDPDFLAFRERRQPTGAVLWVRTAYSIVAGLARNILFEANEENKQIAATMNEARRAGKKSY